MSILTAVFWCPSIADLFIIYQLSSAPIRVGPTSNDVGFVGHPTITVALAVTTALYSMILVSQVGTLLCVRELDGLRSRVRSLTPATTRTWLTKRNSLYLWKHAIVTWLGLSAIIAYSGILSPFPHNPVLGILDVFVIALGLGPTILASFFLATFFLTFVSSIRLIIVKLRSHLTLEDFVVDRRLGLRPFVVSSLRMTFIYEMFVLALVTVLLSREVLNGQPLIPDPYQASPLIELCILGIMIFFAPVMLVHRLLIRARGEYQGELDSARAVLLKPFTENKQSNALLNPGVTQQLQSLKHVEDLVQRIPSWPFDWGQLLKLGLGLTIFALGWFLQQGGLNTLLDMLSRLIGALM